MPDASKQSTIFYQAFFEMIGGMDLFRDDVLHSYNEPKKLVLCINEDDEEETDEGDF